MQKDIETLTTLNHDFVKSAQDADVKRLNEILAKDFLYQSSDALTHLSIPTSAAL
jgi:hypothetical protein